jgi:hypothetical protein
MPASNTTGIVQSLCSIHCWRSQPAQILTSHADCICNHVQQLTAQLQTEVDTMTIIAHSDQRLIRPAASATAATSTVKQTQPPIIDSCTKRFAMSVERLQQSLSGAVAKLRLCQQELVNTAEGVIKHCAKYCLTITPISDTDGCCAAVPRQSSRTRAIVGRDCSLASICVCRPCGCHGRMAHLTHSVVPTCKRQWQSDCSSGRFEPHYCRAPTCCRTYVDIGHGTRSNLY